MFDQSVADARPSLSERLQDVTEALAAARSQQDVFEIVLKPALEALSAIAGAVLLVNGAGDRLEIAATQGYGDGARTIWQGGPLSGNVPAGDALEQHEPLFFEHQGELTRAYPELEERTGMIAPVASAVLPMFEGEHPLGAIILDFKEPHDFTEEEKRFLSALSAQCAIALGRARLSQDLEARVAAHTRELEERTAALDAFAAFTEAVGGETDVLALVRQAIAVLCGRFRDGSIGYYEHEGGLWKARAWSEDMSESLVASLTAGLPASTPLIKQALSAKTAVFTEAWDPEREQIEYTEEYGTAAAYPLFVDGEPRHLLLFGLKDTQQWSARDRALVRAVGRGLGIALERAEQARRLATQNAELDARTKALEGFSELTRDLTLEHDPVTLIGRAQDLVVSLLQGSVSTYYELDGDTWRLRSHRGEFHNPALLAALERGLPRGATVNVDAALDRRQPYWQDRHDPDTVSAAREQIVVIRASVAFPVFAGDHVRGVLAVGLHEARPWTAVERTLLETVMRSLALALERAEAAQHLKTQNAALEARTKALEGFADLTRDLGVETDRLVLVRRAQVVVMSLLPPGYALYYEREGDLWRNKVQVGSVGNADLQAFIDAGPPVGVTPSVDVPWTTRRALYQDDYARGSDTPPEMVEHVYAAASLPVLRGGEPVGVFIAVLFGHRTWTNTDKAVLETVMRSLGLALERAETLRELDRTRHYLSVVAENAPILLFATDARGVFTLSQGSLLEKLGLKSGEAVGHSATAMFAHEPDLREGLRLSQALGGEPAHDLMRFDSRGAVFETWFVPVKNAAGKVSEVVGVSLDVTERLAGQRAVERANAELRRSNAELEQFAYVASHDLQAPIRAVTSFADVIARRYGEVLDERGKAYLNQIVQSGQHMKRLVDDLLMFSRLHTEQRPLQATASGQVLDAVAGRLKPEIEAAGGKVTRGELPTVMADPAQLDQLLQNLVSNGLKYRREGVPPEVHVSAQRDGNFWRFAVSDNGIGIEAQYFERIFVIFQRLHSRNQFEGTGIGLAVCKKIVERHGGQLWLESAPGQGSTFFFTLPGA